MKYIALTGKIATGKTAVAKELEKKGYLLVSYTDLLKDYLADALASAGHIVSVEEINADKEKYRRLLQEFGTVIGFDSGIGFIFESLRKWEEQGRPPCVFDNVRTEAQKEEVESLGFTTVKLKAHQGTRVGRLRAQDKNPAMVMMSENHPIEGGIEVAEIEITTDIATPEMIATFLAGWPDYEETDGFDGYDLWNPDDPHTADDALVEVVEETAEEANSDSASESAQPL